MGIVEGLAALAAVGFAYGGFVEAFRLGLTELEFLFPNLPIEFDGFRILQLSDLHYKKETRIQKWVQARLEPRVAAQLEGRSFDMVALTGDAEPRGEGFEAVRSLLGRIPSSHGAFFVPGNGEYQHYDIEGLLSALESWGVTTLRNASCVIEKDGARVRLIGVDDAFTGRDDLTRAMEGVSSEEFKMLLSHSPAIAREAVKHEIDLVLSGHTHGGQIRLPWLGAVYTHLGRGAPKMDMGVFEGERLSAKIGLDAGATKVYVTRGVGMSNMYVRFLCPPEIAVITLRKGIR